MAFKTNPALEEFEKKHPTAFFVIRLIISAFVIIAGLWLLLGGIEDRSVPILMIVLGALGLAGAIYLKVYRDK